MLYFFIQLPPPEPFAHCLNYQNPFAKVYFKPFQANWEGWHGNMYPQDVCTRNTFLTTKIQQPNTFLTNKIQQPNTLKP